MGARRYSGDVELRIEPHVLDGQVWYVGRVAYPGGRDVDIVSLREAGVQDDEDPRSPDNYDRAARAFLKRARSEVRGLPLETEWTGRPLVRRVFRSPCPVGRGRR